MPATASKLVGPLTLQLLGGVITALLTLNIGSLSTLSANPLLAFAQEVAVCFLFPGLIISIAAAGNVHAFPLWLAATGNFIFYFVLIRIGIYLYRKLRATNRSAA